MFSVFAAEGGYAPFTLGGTDKALLVGALLVALAAWVVAAITRGDVHDFARAAFYAALAAWAWEELWSGANLVRRAIGAAGLVYVVIQVAHALGA